MWCDELRKSSKISQKEISKVIFTSYVFQEKILQPPKALAPPPCKIGNRILHLDGIIQTKWKLMCSVLSQVFGSDVHI